MNSLAAIEKRAWSEVRRNKKGRWAKRLKQISPPRYEELLKLARRWR
ncbi:MAG: hypothetical protein K6T65_14545 [Peptococcaceae bacterium]|nr:hypothetical protein [Peptococcaceae bacterium]